MKKSTKWILLAVVLLVFVVVMVAGVGLTIALTPKRVAADSYLKLSLNQALPEAVSPNPVQELLGEEPLTFIDVVMALQHAKQEARIKGLILRVDWPYLGWARAQELHEALLDFRQSGKEILVYMEVGSTRGYYLASAASKVYMPPASDLYLTGLISEVTFIRGVLDKLKIEPDIEKIDEYKTYANFFTHNKMTPEHREMMDALLDDLYQQLVAGIAEGRGLEPEAVTALIDQGPFLSTEAVEHGLVDETLYWDEFVDRYREEDEEEIRTIGFGDYMERVKWKKGSSGHKIALIFGVGAITSGDSTQDPWSGDSSMGSATITAALRQARENDEVDAILFRVNSPGGSGLASDLIWREITLASEEKPVVVSMSDVAASGGYYVSMGADRIVAQPGTITGSIGIVSGKFVWKGFYDWIGYTKELVPRGAHATIFTDYQRFTPQEREILTRQMRSFYNTFIEKAAQGRGKTPEEINDIGRGRVWTGHQSLELGLVDELGGLTKAIAVTKEQAGIDPEAEVGFVIYPKPKTFWEALEHSIHAGVAAKLPPSVRAHLRTLSVMERLEREAWWAVMPPLTVE